MSRKAFLCHSSLDGVYVDTVARALTRSRVVYDKQAFGAGERIDLAIKSALANNTILFVLFASRNSLASYWVRFEIDAAETLTALRKMSPLVIITDPSIRAQDLPRWMQEFVARTITRSSQAAQLIMTVLFEHLGSDFAPLFVGRDRIMEELERDLIGSAGQRPPHIVAAVGLDGVGRRTILKRAFRDNLSLDIFPTFALHEGDSVENLLLHLASGLGELESTNQADEILGKFRALDAPGRGRELARRFAQATEGNFAGLVVDPGALIDDDGQYYPEIQEMLRRLEEYPDTYVAFVHRRRPDTRFGNSNLIRKQIPHLDLVATERLLTQTLRRYGIESNERQIKDLVPYLDGYPPAVNLAANLAKDYGLDNLLADKSILVQFKVKVFSGILERLRPSETEWNILKILASEAVVTHEVLSELLSIPADELAAAVRRLIDLSLVTHTQGLYEISHPIRDAVFSIRGTLTANEYAIIAKRLREAYWKPGETVPPIMVVDALIHATGRGSPDLLREFGSLVLPSGLFRIAQDAYARDDWRNAVEFAQRVLAMDPEHARARWTLFMSLVRLEEWDRADAVLREIDLRHKRDRFYLRSFMERKRGNFREAIRLLEESITRGYDNSWVRGDLARCFFLIGDLKRAQEQIMPLLDRRPGNRYILDLAVQIQLQAHNLDTAEKLVAELEAVATPGHFHHRRSTLFAARRQWKRALEDAEIACREYPYRFEAFVTRADILIELGWYSEAEGAIVAIERQFRVPVSRSHTVTTGLRIKLALRQGNYREAERLWTMLGGREPRAERNRQTHRALRVEMLKQKLNDTAVTAERRKEAEAELVQLGQAGTMELFADEVEAEPTGSDVSVEGSRD